jgi:hypothetical protein
VLNEAKALFTGPKQYVKGLRNAWERAAGTQIYGLKS